MTPRASAGVATPKFRAPDFRRPEFRDAKADDYEFDGTGELVRKDRWETTVRRIVGLLEDAGDDTVSRRLFTLDALLAAVERRVRGPEPAPAHLTLAATLIGDDALANSSASDANASAQRKLATGLACGISPQRAAHINSVLR